MFTTAANSRRSARATGFPDPAMGQEIAAFVVSEAGMTVDELRSSISKL